MRVEDESLLSKAVLGDAEARRALAARRAADSRLAAELERAERAWNGLELPASAPAPAGFAARTAAAAAAEHPVLPGFTLSPAWAGVAAAFLVAAGVLGGAGLGLYALPMEGAGSGEPEGEAVAFWADDGLLDEQLFAPGAAEDAAIAPAGTEGEVQP